MRVTVLSAVLALAWANTSAAMPVTFADFDLASGNPVTVGGETITTTNVGGSIEFITAGPFIGLHLGGINTSGAYTLNFSQPISSLEVEFDALSSIGPNPPVEMLLNFSTDNGLVTIGYTNQFGTTFDGTTITSTEANGQGIITVSGQTFSAFSFDHVQGSEQNGFVIERVVINPIPEPGSFSLVALGLLALRTFSRRRFGLTRG